MQLRKLLPYLIQGIVVGLLAGFLIMHLFFTPAEDKGPALIEFKEGQAPAAIQRPADSPRAPVSYADAVELAAPAVVNIYTTKIVSQRPHPLLEDPLFRRFFGDRLPLEPRRRLENSLGSGVIVSPQGYILTSNHVIAGADEIEVALNDGRTTSAVVVGADPESDLAVLKIELQALPSITLGKVESLRVGDVVLAIGNPFGVGQTVTLGIVSATGRSQLGISTFENFIQTDAAINPGNSGGALVNPFGQLLGINTAIFTRSGGSQGIGFAIPVSLAKDVMVQIIEHGRVVRGWLGIEAQNITQPLAESFGLKEVKGIVVAGVVRSGPAHVAGLSPGDIITHIDDQAVEDARAILGLIAKTAPGTTITLRGLRQNTALELQATVGERPKPPE